MKASLAAVVLTAAVIVTAAALLALRPDPAQAQSPAPVELAQDAAEAAEELTESPAGPHFTPHHASRGSAATTPQAVEADQAAIDQRLDAWDQSAQQAEAALAAGEATTPRFEAMRAELVQHRAAAGALAERLRAAAQPLAAQLKALTGDEAAQEPPAEAGGDAATPPGDAQAEAPPEGEAEAAKAAAEAEAAAEADAASRSQNLASIRRELQMRVDALESRAKRADLANARADALVREIDELIRNRQVEELLTLGPSPLVPAAWLPALDEAQATVRAIAGETLANAADRARAGGDSFAPSALALAALGLGLLWGVWRGFVVVRRRIGLGSTRGQRALAAAVALLARLVAPVLAIALIRGALGQLQILGADGELVADHIAAGLATLAIGHAIAGCWFSPNTPALRLSSLDDAAATRALSRSNLLAGALGLHQVVVLAGEQLDLSPGTLAVGNLLVLALGAAALWRLAASLHPGPAPDAAPDGGAPDADDADDAPPPDDDPLAESLQSAASVGRRLETLGAFAMRTVALVAVGLAAAGYYAASQRLFYPTVVTVGIVGAGLILFSLAREGVEAALERRTADAGGLRLLTVLVGFVIVLASLPVLALTWGARTSDIVEVWRLASEGVDIGGARLTPMVFFTFALVFAFGYALTRLLQGILASSVLPNTRLDAGARSAITTGLGWTGITAAALVGIAAAGIDLSNIAIVFGALSVGIGFGLQAIASNFISGIILMIERPVKVGDWILVGGTHGVVKRVAVRATEIETFDKTALIVPNSELISGRVVNYTHNNAVGRLILKAPVAYGTDLKGVQKLLLDIARRDRRVLRYPAPMVLMTGFGPAAIELELRVILRDVNQIFDVQTDLFFEIDRRYREAGIEIPYSQNIVTLREPERLAAALRAGLAGEGLAIAEDAGAATPPPAAAPAPSSAPRRRAAGPPAATRGPEGPGVAGLGEGGDGGGGDGDGGR
ncbi:DUF3772 domain-containing protein [Albimonas sp. CAU 1670]|uniref:DUF3772 domain-containing protein n=1 Tax=Albimonas sp. CAU 1670 TaxID=3032599 RepID=UPI0023DB398E|nr:DUF3772 domain-containing protein [Albimonas sp. CAU 1670]MDF2231342.1 DUF3772 domain-containing protein [Albimonas sp. CAU 1670]